MKRWKEELIGLFYWVVLVSSPGFREKPEGRWQKGMVGACTMGIGVGTGAWEVVMGGLRGMVGVQWWLAGGNSEGVEEQLVGKGSKIKGKGKKKGNGGKLELVRRAVSV